MEVKATFIYKDRTINIQCSSGDEVSKLFQSFINKLEIQGKITDYTFIYNGNELEYNSTIAKNKYLSGKKEINIITHKKLRIIKCPKCVSNDCIVNLRNYIAFLYGCKFGHTDSIIYENYNNIQTNDLTAIDCTICKESYNKSFLEFYRCFTCSEMFGCPRYFCNKCISNDPEEHVKVKYDEQNFYCRLHVNNQANKLVKYCFTCKKSLCEECAKQHTEHKIKNFKSMSPDIEGLKKSLNEMEKNIENLKVAIEGIKTFLDGTVSIYTQYYKIAKGIISKYELFNQDVKNYRILKTVRNLQFSNKDILDDLNSIIKEKDIRTKANLIFDIHYNKIKNLQSNKINEEAYIKDNDESWLKEINEKEEPQIQSPTPQGHSRQTSTLQSSTPFKIKNETNINTSKRRGISNIKKKK